MGNERFMVVNVVYSHVFTNFHFSINEQKRSHYISFWQLSEKWPEATQKSQKLRRNRKVWPWSAVVCCCWSAVALVLLLICSGLALVCWFWPVAALLLILAGVFTWSRGWKGKNPLKLQVKNLRTREVGLTFLNCGLISI
jgi:hypothetical protein